MILFNAARRAAMYRDRGTALYRLRRANNNGFEKSRQPEYRPDSYKYIVAGKVHTRTLRCAVHAARWPLILTSFQRVCAASCLALASPHRARGTSAVMRILLLP